MGSPTDMSGRQESLTSLMAALTEALTPEEATAIVAAELTRIFGAERGVIGLVYPEVQALRIVQSVGYGPADLRDWALMPLDSPEPGADVVRSGEPQYWESREAFLARYPAYVDAAVQSNAWAMVPLQAERTTLGLLVLSYSQPRAFSPTERAQIELLCRQCATAVQRTQRFQAMQQARRAAEQSTARIARLQHATAALGAADTPRAIATIIIREAAAATEADAAAFFIYDSEERSFRALEYRGYPAELAPEYAARPADRPGPLRDLLEAQTIIVVRSAEEFGQRWPGLAESQRRTGDQSAVLVPLLLDDHVVGACYLAFREQRQFSDEELTLLLALGQQCAQALERARLYVAERDARLIAEQVAERSSRLYSVTAALAEALSLREVAEVIVTQGRAALGAMAGSVRQLSADGASLEALHVVGYPPHLARDWERIPLDADLPMAAAARSRKPILIESMAEVDALWPQFAGPMRELGYQATALLPLIEGGAPIGAMSFGFSRPRRFSPDDRSFLQALARQCALALERARLYAATQAHAARLGALSEAAQIFAAASLDLPAVLDAVVHQVVRAVGGLGMLGLISDDGGVLELAAIAHDNPEAGEVMGALLRSSPLGVGEGFSSHTLRTGEPRLLAQIPDDLLRALIKPEYHPYLDRFGIHSLMIAPLRANGAVIGTLGAACEQPDRPYTADDLAMLQELADRAALAVTNARLYKQARDAIQVRDNFLAVAAHELKTPLTSLYGQAQLMQRRLQRGAVEPERMARAVGVIVQQAERLSAMMRGLLDVGQIEQGELPLERQPIDLGGLVGRIVREMRPELSQHPLSYSPPLEPVIVAADPMRLEQVLQNLLGNAVKYSPAGGAIEVRVSLDGAEAAVDVQDHGIGIPLSAIPHLFQRFYRAENGLAHRISGMGIGLYIVREIISRHGGRIDVASVEGEGTTFSIRLPVTTSASHQGG